MIGNAYAPTTPLTTAQLKDIFECTITDWSEVGGQAGPIHVYLPPASAATLTFFLQAIGTNLTNVNAGCAGLPTVFPTQQNDGRTMNGDPHGHRAVRRDEVGRPEQRGAGIADYRGGAHIGLVNTTTAPTTTHDARRRDLPGAEPGLHDRCQRVLRPALLQRGPQRRARRS